MITFYQLESFCKIVEEGSFHSAAEKLFISQPSVSQHVASLEKHLQIQLFVRQGRKTRLTPEGRLLYSTATEILGKLSALEGRFKALKNLEFGELKIGCSSFTGTHILPRALDLFRHRYSQIRISVISGTADEVIRRLQDNDLELVLLGKNLNWTSEPRLTYKAIGLDELLFVAAPSHPLAGQTVPVRTLEGQTLISFSEGNTLNSYMRDFMLRSEIRPQKVIDVDELGIGIRLALQGMGITLTSRLAVSDELARGALRPVHLEDGERHTREIDAIYHSGRGLTYAGWEMLKILEKMSGLVLL